VKRWKKWTPRKAGVRRIASFIDPELRWLTRPLGGEELEQLPANVLCDGCATR
jgi:hypothetical protein